MRRIELDITYRCNLRRFNCNRLCGLLQRPGQLSVSDVRRFAEESTAENVRWNRVAVLGGEPTLHPDLREILCIVSDVADEVLLVTNGVSGVRSADDISLHDKKFVVDNTNKSGRVHEFYQVTDAPIDSRRDVTLKEYAHGCVVRECGISFTPNGYLPCPVAGSVDDVFELRLAKRTLHDIVTTDYAEMFKVLCPLCGHFWDVLGRQRAAHGKQIISESWQLALRQYIRKHPECTRYLS